MARQTNFPQSPSSNRVAHVPLQNMPHQPGRGVVLVLLRRNWRQKGGGPFRYRRAHQRNAWVLPPTIAEPACCVPVVEFI